MNETHKTRSRKWASPVNLLILLVFIFVAGMVALGSHLFMERSIVKTVEEQDEHLFPRLSDESDDVAGILIERGQDRLELVRRNDGRRDDTQWGLANWDGYPVDEEKVAGLIDDLAALRGVETSTDQISAANIPDLRDRNTATEVTVRDNEGAVVAGLIIGDTVATPGGAEINRTFVQPRGAERAWLSAREIRVPVDHTAWISPIILDIAPDRIAVAKLRDTDGNRLEIERQENMEQPFKPTNQPEGTRVSEPWLLTRVAAALEKLQIVEARKADGSSLPADTDKLEAEFKTLDGLRVKLAMAHQGDATWAEIEAQADDASTAKPEADSINARTAGWHFRLPDFVTKDLTANPEATVRETDRTPEPAQR